MHKYYNGYPSHIYFFTCLFICLFVYFGFQFDLFSFKNWENDFYYSLFCFCVFRISELCVCVCVCVCVCLCERERERENFFTPFSFFLPVFILM